MIINSGDLTSVITEQECVKKSLQARKGKRGIFTDCPLRPALWSPPEGVGQGAGAAGDGLSPPAICRGHCPRAEETS